MRKSLEFGEYVAIGTGMAMACSSFMVIGGALRYVAGPWLVLAIAVAGLLTMPIALSIAEWASLLPGGGGIGAYLKAAFGERLSLFMMFLYLSLVGCLAGVESYVFTQLLERLFPGTFPALPSALAILAAVIALNLSGFEFSREFQTWTTGLLSAGILVLAASAFRLEFARPGAAGLGEFHASAGMLARFACAVGASIFLFVGFEWVAPLGRSPKAYRALIPASMVATVLLLAVLYGTFALALVTGPGSDAARGSALPQFTLSAWALGTHARYAAAALSLLAMITSFNAGMLGAGRMIYALARQKRLPAALAKLSGKNGNPVNAVAAAGVLACLSAVLIIATDSPMAASSLSACIECLVYGALLFGLLKHRRGSPVNRGGFRTPVPAFAQAALAACLPVLGVSALFVDAASGPRALGVLAVLCLGAWVYSARALRPEPERAPASAPVAALAPAPAPALAAAPIPAALPAHASTRQEGIPS